MWIQFVNLIGLTWLSSNCTLRWGTPRILLESRRQYRWINVFKFKWPQMTTRWSYRESGTSAGRWLKQYDCQSSEMEKPQKRKSPKIRSNEQRGVSTFPKSKRSEENCKYPVFYRHENSAFKSQSTNGPMWPSMTNLKVLQRPCESCWTALLNCYGQSLVPTSNGATWPRVVSTMIWQMFETNISSNLHISILDLDFSLVGPRPLYSILGNEESRIFGSC